MSVPDPGAGPGVRASVPYFSQWESADLVDDIVHGRISAQADPLWQRSGARTVEEYEFWSKRSCGVACLRMVLAERGIEVPSQFDLGLELLRTGAYTFRDGGLNGLIYEPCVEYLDKRWDIAATVRAELSGEELFERIVKGDRVIASVHHDIRLAPEPPPHRGGHLVLVYGADRDADVFEFHNPSGLNSATQRAVRLPRAEFARYFAERGICVSAFKASSECSI